MQSSAVSAQRAPRLDRLESGNLTDHAATDRVILSLAAYVSGIIPYLGDLHPSYQVIEFESASTPPQK